MSALGGENDWLHALELCGERGHDAVLVRVLAGKGSTPREAGAKMVVTPDAVHGTIGGGELEFRALEIARGLLRERGDRATRRFPLGASLGQVCGGAAELSFERVPAAADWVRALAARHAAGAASVLVTPAAPDEAGCLIVDAAGVAWGGLGDAARDRAASVAAQAVLASGEDAPRIAEVAGGAVLLEPLRPTDFEIVLFGAGHVGRALARVLGTLPCRLTWVDSRPAEFPPDIPPNAVKRVTDAALDCVRDARPGAYFLVLTHSHALDFELVAAILRRGDFAYCGMIGSATKRRTFENGLVKKGIPAAALQRLTCPIGIASLKGKAPATIAIAVAAQLLEVRERRAAEAAASRAARG
jgi:xanthine dehydrogenase accessory factor